jgi:PmbA protein
MFDTLHDLIAKARAAGADAADCVLIESASVSVERRLGQMEKLERSESRDLGLRVFIGSKSAIVSASSLEPSRFATLAEHAVAMARVVPDDPFAAPPEEVPPPDDTGKLDLADDTEPDIAALIERAQTAEEAALQVSGITNSEGGSAGWSRSTVSLVTSAGFAGRHTRTSHSVSASVIAGTGTEMQRDYDYHATSHLADLEDPALVGRRAGDRAVARMNPVRAKTASLPVIYDPRVSGSLLNHLAGAINGASIARGTSFLKEKLGQRIFAPGITIRDDPRRPRGQRSRVFDGEGMRTVPLNLVEDGILRSWLLDARSARHLGLTSTGHASRGTRQPPGPAATNLYLEPGTATPAELMAGITEGFYVTELIGNSLNSLTGDYSRGAAGFMIRNGALAEPVAEVTIAGNLLTMYPTLVPANDLQFRRVVDAPTIRVETMTLAGA